MKLYLIRHGQSEGNLRQVFHGQFDYPLTAQGREEALLCGEKLRDVPLVRCCASDLRRARETAELALSGRDVPITLLPALRELGFRSAAMALRRDTISIRDVRLQREPKLAVVLGTEGEGLRQSTIDGCDYTVLIPMANGVDSLNVAAASAVAFWELSRQ